MAHEVLNVDLLNDAGLWRLSGNVDIAIPQGRGEGPCNGRSCRTSLRRGGAPYPLVVVLAVLFVANFVASTPLDGRGFIFARVIRLRRVGSLPGWSSSCM
jgi:hypothetical protein